MPAAHLHLGNGGPSAPPCRGRFFGRRHGAIACPRLLRFDGAMLARPRRRVPPRSATAIDAYIGAQMRKRRLVLKMSQADLAKTLGVSTQQIQKYEVGQNRVSAARLFDICRDLNVSLSSMFERNPKA
jgi:DNA-binding XRE family transcriptional regulator